MLEESRKEIGWTPGLQGLTAADIMNHDVVAVTAASTLKQIAECFAFHRISAVPVIDAERKVIGIVSETDLIDEEKRRVRLPRTVLFGVFPILEEAVREAYNEGATLTAEELMTRKVFTVPDNYPVRTLAEDMLSRKINHVPVTREGKLAGIIARADLLKTLQKSWESLCG